MRPRKSRASSTARSTEERLNKERMSQEVDRFQRWQIEQDEVFRPPERAIIEVDGGDQEYRVDLAVLAAIRPGTAEFMAKYVQPPDPELKIIGSRGGRLIVENAAGERLYADASGVGTTR